ncbi:hypothetical protein NC653_030390 [Populus alba x Populus x berolinensis]|uniref:Uncharacterized protein n=1 Tax=Populus alba x Populus x berolinensis TaxID=444605 RepID=A0AAD6LW70_9ROSI|nr:hypothetical protein NC653_030390 [Populus alba x Populus x berolinensis]
MISQRDRSLMVDGILVQVIHADDVVGAGPPPLSPVVSFCPTKPWPPHREPESSSNNLPASRAMGKCGKGTPA